MLKSDETFRWAFNCLNGEITPEMRMVVFRQEGLNVKFRYYLDREPTDFVRERAEIVALNFEAGLSMSLDRLDIEYVHTTESLGFLDNLDGSLFRRWENKHGTTTPD